MDSRYISKLSTMNSLNQNKSSKNMSSKCQFQENNQITLNLEAKISRTSPSFGREQQTSANNIDMMDGEGDLDFLNEMSIEFQEASDLYCPLFDCKEICNSEGHLHDTIPHEDELKELEAFNSKQRKNLRAKKRKKSKYEVKILEEYFAKDPEWSRQTVKQLKPLLNLTVDQIYKWGYDKKHLVEKRKMNITRKKRGVRKAQTMQTIPRDSKIVPITQAFQQLDEDENDVIHDLVFDQIACNSCLFEAGHRPKEQLNSFAKVQDMKESLYFSRDVTNLEILSDSKIDKVFFENSSEVIDENNLCSVKEIFSQEESDCFIGIRY